MYGVISNGDCFTWILTIFGPSSPSPDPGGGLESGVSDFFRALSSCNTGQFSETMALNHVKQHFILY